MDSNINKTLLNKLDGPLSMTVDHRGRLIIYTEAGSCEPPKSFTPFDSDCPFVTLEKADAKIILDWLLAYETEHMSDSTPTDIEIFGDPMALSYERLYDRVHEGVYPQSNPFPGTPSVVAGANIQTPKMASVPSDNPDDANNLYSIVRLGAHSGSFRGAIIVANTVEEALDIVEHHCTLGNWKFDPSELDLLPGCMAYATPGVVMESPITDA